MFLYVGNGYGAQAKILTIHFVRETRDCRCGGAKTIICGHSGHVGASLGVDVMRASFIGS